MPTKTELAWLSIIFRIVIICVAPASLLIYHSRLLTLDAFLHLKKHQFEFKSGRMKHRRRWRQLRILFCCSAMRKYNYSEYVQFRNKVKNWYEVMADIVTAAIICLIVFFYNWNVTIDEFKLPFYYLYLVVMLLMQKQVMFLLKTLAFIPVYLISRSCRCFRKNRSKLTRGESELHLASYNNN